MRRLLRSEVVLLHARRQGHVHKHQPPHLGLDSSLGFVGRGGR